MLLLGEGNGTPLQYSCLENPMNEGAWWAAVCGVTQSRTQLKWLSSSSRLTIANLQRLKWLNEINCVKGLAQKNKLCFLFKYFLFLLNFPNKQVKSWQCVVILLWANEELKILMGFFMVLFSESFLKKKMYSTRWHS